MNWIDVLRHAFEIGSNFVSDKAGAKFTFHIRKWVLLSGPRALYLASYTVPET